MAKYGSWKPSNSFLSHSSGQPPSIPVCFRVSPVEVELAFSQPFLWSLDNNFLFGLQKRVPLLVKCIKLPDKAYKS